MTDKRSALTDEAWDQLQRMEEPPPADDPAVTSDGYGNWDENATVASLTGGDGPPAQRDSLIHWPDFWAADHNAEDWIVEPILPRGRSVSTYSPAGSGKSLLCLDVGACKATGKAILDQPAGEPEHVVYFDLEMTEGDLQERLREMGYGPDTDLSHLHYYLLPDLPPLDTAAGGAEIRRIAALHDAALVIIDTTSRVIAGPENDADTFRAYHRHTGQPLKADGRTVWRLDHAGKDLDRGQRGSSAKNDDVDLIWELVAREGGTVRLRAKKRRVSWVPETLDLVRLDDPLRHHRAKETWPTGTAELAATLDRLSIPLDHGRGKARQALQAAEVPASNDVLNAALRWRRQEHSHGLSPL